MAKTKRKPIYKCDAFFKRMNREYVGLTFGDVRLNTSHSNIKVGTADLGTKLTKRIRLKMPIVSSCMDTVTEADMAIEMAKNGGAGVIHKNNTIAAQAKQVHKVKHNSHALIPKPITVQASSTVQDVEDERKEKGYSFYSFPVVDKKGKVVGIVTKDDFRFSRKGDQTISEIMSTDLVKAPVGTTPQQAYDIMSKHKKKVLPVFDRRQNFKGMFVLGDVERILNQDDANYSLDKAGRLIVGAAVGIYDLKERMKALAKANVDFVVVDSAHGDSVNVIKAVKYIKKTYPHIDVIAGNVSTAEGALRLVRAGADAVRVGQGPGSICTTRIIAGVGCPQVTAVYQCAYALRGTGVPVIADGGIESSGDMVIVLAAGAATVMLGSLFAGTYEAPGEVLQLPIAGSKDKTMSVKVYRGMGSSSAMKDHASSQERYGQKGKTSDKFVPEGVSGYVPYRGTVAEVLIQYLGGIHSGMGYTGSKNILSLQKKATFIRITNAGQKESHPHGLAHMEAEVNYKP